MPCWPELLTLDVEIRRRDDRPRSNIEKLPPGGAKRSLMLVTLSAKRASSRPICGRGRAIACRKHGEQRLAEAGMTLLAHAGQKEALLFFVRRLESRQYRMTERSER
jgi:hypothetical protein